MANMGYCRFQNTALDLSDCLEHIDDCHLSVDESMARKRLIKLCIRAIEELGGEVNYRDDVFSTLDEFSSGK